METRREDRSREATSKEDGGETKDDNDSGTMKEKKTTKVS